MSYSRSSLSPPILRLRLFSLYLRWLVVLGCWLIVAPLGIWGLRTEIRLWRDYFTWSAVRYGLAYHWLPAFCLLFCVGITLSTLILQLDYLWGSISEREKNRLECRLRSIAQLNPHNPLRRWILP